MKKIKKIKLIEKLQTNTQIKCVDVLKLTSESKSLKSVAFLVRAAEGRKITQKSKINPYPDKPTKNKIIAVYYSVILKNPTAHTQHLIIQNEFFYSFLSLKTRKS